MSTDENAIESSAPQGQPITRESETVSAVDLQVVASAPELAGLGDGAMGFISSIQGQLAELGRIASETARRASVLDQREATLAVRTAELHQVRQKVEQMGGELSARQQTLEDEHARRSVEIESRERTLSNRQSELERQLALAQGVENDRQAVDQDRRDLEALQSELASQRETVQADRAAMESTFADESACLHQTREEIEASAAQLADARAQLSEARAQLDQANEALARDRAVLVAATGAVESDQAELESRRQQLAHHQSAVDAQRQELELRATQLEEQSLAAHAWQEETDAELAKHERAVNEREKTLESREQELARRDQELSRREQELSLREQELLQSEQRVNAMAEQASQSIALGENAKAELERINIERQELQHQRAELDTARVSELATIEQREKTFNQRLASIQKKADALDDQQRTIAQERAAAETSLRQSEQVRAMAEQELAESRKLMSADRAAGQRLVTMEQDQEQLRRAFTEETARRSQIERAFAELEESAASTRREAQRSLEEGLTALEGLETTRARCAELEATIASLDSTSRTREASLTSELEAERLNASALEQRIQQIDTLASEEHARLSSAVAETHRLTAELASSQARVGELADLASDVERGAGDAAESLRAQLEAVRASGEVKVAEMAAKLEALERTLGQSQECQTLAEQSTAAMSSEHERATSELAEAKAVIASTNAAIAEARNDAERARQNLATAEQGLVKVRTEAESARAELATHATDERAGEASQRKLKELGEALVKREDAIRVLSKRVEEAEQRIEDAEHRADEAEAARQRAQSDAPGAADAFVERLQLRHSRLVRYKKLLSTHAMKIVKAKAAIEKKGEQYNELLSQQNRIMEAATALKQERSRVQAKLARSQSASMLFFAVGTIAIVGIGSWFAATKMAPATFAARTTLIADGKGRVPAEDDLRAWTASHEKMLEDPQFFQLVAERFAQRGMSSLGTSPSVAQKLRNDLSFQTDTAGKLTLELRSQGQERTVRELETVTLAMVAVANAQREARGDGAATAIDSPPVAGNEPIADQRMLYVATFGGGGLLLSVIIWLILYRALAQSKRNFEQQLSIET